MPDLEEANDALSNPSLDPGKHPNAAVQVGEGAADEYEESKSSGSQEKVADVKAQVGDMSDDELADLAASDDRKGVQDAVAAEQAKRAEDSGSDS
jgi:hypothetical protein